MEIKILRSAATEVELKRTIWHSYALRQLVLITLIITIGIIFITTSMANHEGNFWRFETCFGITIMVIGLLRIADYIKNRSNYFSNASGTSSLSSEIVINKNEITYAKDDFKISYQWHYYQFYKITDDLIFLKKNLSPLSQLVISKHELSEENLSALLFLLGNKPLKRSN